MMDFDKLPRIGFNNNNNNNKDSDSSNCMVPIIESKSDRQRDENNARRFNNCVPDDLILSIKQAEIPKEFLGPPNKKTLQNYKPTIPSVLKRPDNAWNYEKQRDKFKFLTEQPICSCGAGKDISFIYDCVVHRNLSKTSVPPSKYDLSAVRINEINHDRSIRINDSLVPDEFRVVKSQGVWPLKVEDEKYTTYAEDHFNHLTIFPSLKPSGRNEVLQLKHTMEALLKRVGADIIDQTGPTQLHNLLEIIKQEQDIYNIVFHEVIRQVTVECKDRGEVLAKLRERYANLLSRVPREIKSLHEEIVAQRALDRRLTEELMQFKTTIEYLTEELTHVKQHDKLISEQANIYQKDLREALGDARNNASLLNEYHDLYELQRRRLEKTIDSLIEERDMWTKTSYNIALKVTNENKLVTAQRLNVAEKAWAKLAKHFALLISDKNAKDLNEIQKHTDTWKDVIEELRFDIVCKENQTRNVLEQSRVDLDKLKWILSPNTTFNEKGQLINAPDSAKIASLLNHLKKIYEITIKDSENFSGDMVLNAEENLKKGERALFQIVQLSTKIISRHEPAKEQSKIDKYMKYEHFESDIKLLQEQYRNRSSGDNGLSRNYSILNSGIDLWIQKFMNQLINEKSGKSFKATSKLDESEWSSFLTAIDDWQDCIKLALRAIGWPLRQHTDLKPTSALHENENKIIVHEEIFIEIHKWLTAICQHIDTQDACLVDEVTNNHKKMIDWMIQSLIRLAPDREELSNEVKKLIYNPDTTIEVIVKNGEKLIEAIEKFTVFLMGKASEIIPKAVIKNPNEEETNVPNEHEKETKKLASFQSDCQEWTYTLRLLMGELGAVGLTRAKSVFDPEQSEKDESFIDDNEVKIIERNDPKNQTKQSNYTQASTDQSTSAIETDTDTNKTMATTDPAESKTEMQSDLKNETETETKIAPPIAAVPTFEILTSDSNTQRKFLENITLSDSNHLSENELKSTVFNAINTIEKLQTELLTTEERAQNAETLVTDLELKLKEANEKIRALEKNNPE